MMVRRSRKHDAIRRFPVVCFFVALFYIMTGRLSFPKLYLSRVVECDDDQMFAVFRHMTLASNPDCSHSGTAVLVVRLHFARFTQAVNRRLSLIPIPLIAGYPGFRHKIWTANAKTGEWQGLYEWDSEGAARDYVKSFVLRTMTRRAVNGSVSTRIIPDMSAAALLRRTGNGS